MQRGMARVFVTRQLPGPALDRLRSIHEVEVWPERLPPSAEEFAAGAAEAAGLLTLLTEKVDAALLERCPQLRAIANYAVGYDNIDLAATAARGIPVGNTPDVLTDATADLTFALLLAAARKLPEAIDAPATGLRGSPGSIWAPRCSARRSGSSGSGGSAGRWRGGRRGST
jgi:glyoxylate reductase